jgi:hypothetical protein
MVKSQIDIALQPSDPKTIHKEVASIRLSDDFTAISASSGSPENPVSSDNDKGLSRVGILLIVISSMLIVAIAYYFYIQWNERKMGDTIFSNKKTRSSAFRRSYKESFRSDVVSIHSSPSFEDDDIVLHGEDFEDEYGSDDLSHASHISRTTTSSTRVKSQIGKASLLQYSSRASTRSSAMEQEQEKW